MHNNRNVFVTSRASLWPSNPEGFAAKERKGRKVNSPCYAPSRGQSIRCGSVSLRDYFLRFVVYLPFASAILPAVSGAV
jgi:hypothetical protein